MAQIQYPRIFAPVYTPAAAETILEDKWHQPVSQPILRRGVGLQALLTAGAIGGLSTSATSAYRRASTATYFNTAGTLTTAAINEIRYTYNPATLAALGILLENNSTNIIRNPRAEGAATGTPGTLPTNWFTYQNNGITLTIVAVGGSESGIPCIDIQFSGTATATGIIEVAYDSNQAVLPNTAFTHSVYTRIIAGSTTNVNAIAIQWDEYNNTTYLSSDYQAITVTTAALASQRFSVTATSGSTTNVGVPLINLAVTSGNAINITLRIGGPQFEQGPAATSLILPPAGSPGQAYRAPDLPYPDVGEWQQPASAPVRLPRAQHTGSVANIAPVTAETILADKWGQPLSQPVARARTAQQGGSVQPISTSPETVTADRWQQPLSQPVIKPPVAQMAGSVQPISTLPESVTADRWLQPLSQPVIKPPVAQAAGSVQPISTSPETVTADRWAQPFSQPVIKPPVAQAAGMIGPTTLVVPPETILEDKWHQPVSQPLVRAKVAQQAGAVQPISTLPESVTADRWLQPLSQPVALPKMPSGWTGGPIAPATAAPEVVTIDKWFQPASEPLVRTRPGQQAGITVGPVSTSPETVTADRWAQPPSQPVRRTVAQPAGMVGPVAPVSEIVLPDKWFQPPSQPVARARSAAQSPAATWNTYTPPYVAPTVFGFQLMVQAANPVALRLPPLAIHTGSTTQFAIGKGRAIVTWVG